MKMYNVTCPVCSAVNRNLYLDETDGWMECEHCGQVSNVKDIIQQDQEISSGEVQQADFSKGENDQEDVRKEGDKILNSGTLRTFKWRCPICGAVSSGIRKNQGYVRLECSKCRLISIHREMGRSHGRVDYYYPAKDWHPENEK